MLFPPGNQYTLKIWWPQVLNTMAHTLFIWQANIYTIKNNIKPKPRGSQHNTKPSESCHLDKKRQKAFLAQIPFMIPVIQLKAGLPAIKTQRRFASVVTFLHASCIMLLCCVECVCSAHVVKLMFLWFTCLFVLLTRIYWRCSTFPSLWHHWIKQWLSELHLTDGMPMLLVFCLVNNCVLAVWQVPYDISITNRHLKIFHQTVQRFGFAKGCTANTVWSFIMVI